MLGTSRGEIGYDPNHKYFMQPAYDLAISAGTLYEARLYFEQALKQKNVKQVLFIADYIMFNNKKQKNTQEIETYFAKNSLSYLVSIQMFKDAISTIKRKKGCHEFYKPKGQAEYSQCFIDRRGGPLKAMQKNEFKYYLGRPTNYIYKDTKNNSFDDFDKILKACYENNIKLVIIFGPSHVRMWESLDYYLGYDNWLRWKKDVVFEVEKVAKNYDKKPFSIYDFSTYNQFTTEKVPDRKKATMKWHWESSHYKNKLGEKVLNVLNKDEKYDNFGVKLNTSNIDKHLKKQKENRKKYVDTKKYRKEFEKYAKKTLK